jgi:hypothetical protein
LTSRNELIAKILVDIIEEDKQNDIGSIVFVTRSSCFITQEEADENANSYRDTFKRFVLKYFD